jgi:EmrB/QacA subfamily drug resistance transporter
MAAIGVGLGPLAGGLLLEAFDWSSVFLVNVPIAALALILGFRLVPESRDPDPGSLDLPGVALSVATLVTLVYGIIEAPEVGWTDPQTLGCIGGALILGAAFIIWELRTKNPLLNLDFFKDPHFSVASMGISVAFFSLFGAIFATTQFLQEAMGYSALEAGAAMVPIAAGLVVGAGSGIKLTERFGSTAVITAGLTGIAVLLASVLLWESDMPYWPIGIWFFALSCSMGWIMGPATSSVMGSVPEEKAGVASAMNDVTRQLGGAIGTAVVGSLISSLYATNLADSVSGAPDPALSSAEDSIGAANAVAASLPASDGAQLINAANSAFVDAMGSGFAVAAAFALIAAVFVKKLLPSEGALPRPGRPGKLAVTPTPMKPVEDVR